VVLDLRRLGRWQALHFPVPGETGYTLEEEVDLAVLRAVGRTGVASTAAGVSRSKGRWALGE
jgi:hypothetical protein